MTITLDSLTRDADSDISLDDDNVDLNGWCWWNGYWRSLDSNDSIVYAYTSTGTPVPDENITLEDLSNYSGLTTDGTNLIVLRGGTNLAKNIYTVTPADPPVITEVSLSAPTSATNPRAGAIAFDVDNQQYWIAWIGDTGDGAWLQPYDTSFAEATGGFTGPTTARRITGMSWYADHLLCAGLDETRFRIFNLADNNNEVNITTVDLPADIRGLGVKDDTAFIASESLGAQAWTINFTDSDVAVVPDAPTGLTVELNADEYIILNWDDPNDDTITGYLIERKRGNGEFETLEENYNLATNTYALESNFEGGEELAYRIAAINATGTSSYSNEVEIRIANHYTASLSDSLSITDAVTSVRNVPRPLIDSLSITDAITRIKAITVRLTEGSTTSQAITVEASKSPDLDIADASIGGVSEAVYDSPSFDVSDEDTFPSDVIFSPDGLKMFVLGASSDSIYQYTLSTAWDINTAVYDSVLLDVSSQEGAPYGFTFSPDGTKMFIVGALSDSVHSYSLATAWDISDVTYISAFNVGSEDGSPHGVTFSPDGLKMFIVGAGSDSVYQYTLSTAWDISTAVHHSISFSVNSEDTFPSGVTFSTDGLKMFIMGNSTDSVYQYSLTTAWDISDVTYNSVSLDITSQDTFPHGVTFSSDGTKMFVIGSSSDSVHAYNIPLSAGITSDDITVSDDYRTATDGVSVTIDTTHTDRTSLSFRVRNPAGDWTDSINLADSASQSFNLTFPNEGDTDGTWRIEITDGTPGIVGTLDSWDLDITTTSVTETTTSGSLSISDSITRTKSFGARVSLSDSLSITDSITRLKAATRSLADSIMLSDILHGSTAMIVRLTDSLSITDIVTRMKTTTRSLSDSLSISDGITWLKGTTRSLTDSISLSDSVTRSKSVIRSLFDPQETIGSAVPVGNPDQNVQGMAWTGSHIIQLAGTGSNGYLAAHPYNYDTNILTENTTITLTTRRLRGCAYVNSVAKVIVASINPDIVHDYDVSADGTFTNERELIVEDLPESLHGLAYHALSGRVVGVDVATDIVYDWLYDPVAGTLSDRRPLTSNILATPRSVATYGIKTLVISEIDSDNLYAFDYDFVAGVLSMQRTLIAETNIYGSTFIRDRLFFARVNTSGISDILYRSYTPRAFVITDSITRTVARTKSLIDSLSISDSMTKIQASVRSLADTITITDVIHVGTAGIIRLADSLAITDSITRLKTATRSMTDSLSITDSAIKLKTTTRTLSDSLSISDGITRLKAATRSLTDSLSATDTITKLRHVHSSLTDSLSITDSIAKLKSKTNTLTDSLSITDSVTRLKAAKRSFTESLTITDTIYASTAGAIRLVDSLSITDSMTMIKAATRSLSDSLSISDTVSEIRTELRSLTDSLSISDTISKIRAVTVSLTEGATTTTVTPATPDSLGDAVSLGSSLESVVSRGMAYHNTPGMMYYVSHESGTSTIASRLYNTITTLIGAALSTQDTLSSMTITALAVSGNKLLAAQRSPTNQMYDYDISTTDGAISNIRTITPSDIPGTVHGMSVHQTSGKVAISDVATAGIYDYDYNSATGVMDAQRLLVISDGVFTPTAARSISFHGDKLIISDFGTDKMYSYNYDSVAGTLSGETELADETNVQASTFAGDDLLLIRDDRIIYRRPFTAGTPSSTSTVVSGAALSISDALTKSSGAIVLLSDSLSITDSLTRLKAATRALTDSVTISDVLHGGTAGVVRLSDSLAITDAVTRMKTTTRSLSDSLSITDTVRNIRVEIRRLADSLSITDSAVIIQTKLVQLTDSLSITDAATRMQTRVIRLADSLSITDGIIKSQTFVRTLSDSLSITDRLHVPQDYIRHLTDSLSITDSAAAFKRNITRSRIYRATLNRVFRAKLG